MKVRLEEVHFRYEESATETIKGVDLSIEEGKNYALIGRNGSGKTTLLRLIMGFLKPDSGRIVFPDSEQKPEIGFSPEDPQLGFFEKTVKEELEFYPKNLGLDYEKIAEETLKKIGITHLKKRSPYLLSSGQQRLVSIASVLSGLPEILVLDEPTHSLHRKGEKMVGEVLKDLEKTILFSTHSSDLAFEVADEVVVLHQGEVLEVGKARDIFSDIETLEEAGVRTPGLVSWARKNSIEVPSSLDEAVELVKEGKR